MERNKRVLYVVVGMGVVACVVLVVWLTRSGSERGRQAVRAANGEVAQRVREGLVDGAERADENAAELPHGVGREDEVVGQVVQTAERPNDEAAEAPGRRVGDRKEASGAKPPTAIDAFGDLFGLGHEIARTLDDIGQEILGLTAEEEMALGGEVHAFVCRNHKVLPSPTLVRRLENLARPMMENRGRKDIQYKIFVLDDSAINAFAHVGGYLYVTKGMIDFVQSDAELQFVLGHEIGHVDLKHCSRQASYVAKAREFGGDAGGQLAMIAYHAIALGYSEQQEFEADEYGMRAVMKTGQSGQHAIAFLQRVQKKFDEGGHDAALEGNALGEAIQQIENHFRSHPPASERVARLDKLLEDSD